MTRVEIDPNCRVRGNQTFAGFEDVNGAAYVGMQVTVFESESDVEGIGIITHIDASKQLVYLSVDWENLRPVEERVPAASIFMLATSGLAIGSKLRLYADLVTKNDDVPPVREISYNSGVIIAPTYNALLDAAHDADEPGDIGQGLVAV